MKFVLDFVSWLLKLPGNGLVGKVTSFVFLVLFAQEWVSVSMVSQKSFSSFQCPMLFFNCPPLDYVAQSRIEGWVQ
jgi:hypothetical protein